MPDWLVSLFNSGAVAGLAIAVLVIETAILFSLRRRLGLTATPLLCNAASGIALIMALRAALIAPQEPLWIAVWLFAGFVAHLGDIWSRVNR